MDDASTQVSKSGDARVALIGFPSVGKSSLLSKMTNTESSVAAYEYVSSRGCSKGRHSRGHLLFCLFGKH